MYTHSPRSVHILTIHTKLQNTFISFNNKLFFFFKTHITLLYNEIIIYPKPSLHIRSCRCICYLNIIRFYPQYLTFPLFYLTLIDLYYHRFQPYFPMFLFTPNQLIVPKLHGSNSFLANEFFKTHNLCYYRTYHFLPLYSISDFLLN